MALIPPQEGWEKVKVARDEKLWMWVAFLVCIGLFLWMVLWHAYGRQNPSNVTYRVSPQEFMELHDAFVMRYKVGEWNGVPVVRVPEGGDVVLMARQWQWSPIVILKKGAWYTFHISSVDVVHGFSLLPINVNFMVLPDYDYVLRFKPTEAGEYSVVCNEFCGIGHHLMIGKIIVIESEEDLAQYQARGLKLTTTENL